MPSLSRVGFINHPPIVAAATISGRGGNPGPGDRALADLLLLHGLAMNGGVLHAFDCLDQEEIDRAIAGFVFFGLSGTAELLRSLPDAIAAAGDNDDAMVEFEQSTDARYIDDAAIETAFRRSYMDQPGSFAPLL